MEEAEHGTLTSSHLKKDKNAIARFMIGWNGLLVLYLYFIVPIFGVAIRMPKAFLNVNTWIQLAHYLFVAICTIMWANIFYVVFWIFPIEEPLALYETIRGDLMKRVDARGIKFEVTNQKDYTY